MSAYYNENDPKAAAWLRELIKEGHIAPGVVDERSIIDIRPHEIYGYTQQHFFAGIGGWSLALRLAGWDDSKPVRTGSCPCQPFSISGKGLGEADERHLWPNFRDLITFGEPTVTFGEQVASAAGRDWLARVRADLEGLGYEVGAADLCAASTGAPHMRQRLYWMANADGRKPWNGKLQPRREFRQQPKNSGDLQTRGLVLANSAGRDARRQRATSQGHGRSTESAGGDGAARLEHAESNGREQRRTESSGRCVVGGCGDGAERLEQSASHGRRGSRLPIGRQSEASRTGEAGGRFWSDFDVLPFRDGKFRRVEAGTFPLAARLPRGMVPIGDPSVEEAQVSAENRADRLRGYGNSIVPQLAAEFILASMEALP